MSLKQLAHTRVDVQRPPPFSLTFPPGPALPRSTYVSTLLVRTTYVCVYILSFMSLFCRTCRLFICPPTFCTAIFSRNLSPRFKYSKETFDEVMTPSQKKHPMKMTPEVGEVKSDDLLVRFKP
jgi:hypothetical protein